MKYLFVGEKRSRKARQMKVTWESGKLAAKTLQKALSFSGISLDDCGFINILQENLEFNLISNTNLRKIKSHVNKGVKIIAMGKLVQRHLANKNIPHISIVHPAARGKIRKTELYNQHLYQTFQKLS